MKSYTHSSWGRTAALAAALAATGLLEVGVAAAQRMRLDHHAGFLARSAAARNNIPPGYLGVDVRDAGDEQPSVPRPRGARGAEILHVDHDGPAGKAGLREHDIILQMNGQPIEGEEHIRRMIRETPPGKTVTLIVVRDGQQQTLSAQMANKEDVERQAWQQHIPVPDPAASAAPAPEEHHGNSFFSAPGRASRNFIGSIVSPAYTGAVLETMAPQLAEFFGAQGKTGLLVRSVDTNSPAALAGMHAGDVVVRVNSAAIVSSSDWLRAVRDNKGKTIGVVVLRDRREQTLQMIPNSKHHSSLLPDLWPHFFETAKPVPPPQQACILPTPFSM